MSNYDSSNIKVLKGLDAVRKRPGMYIGSTDINGLHHLVWEIVDNAMDEVLAGYANTVKVTLKKDNSVVVEDNGRGIPVDLHKESGKSGVELIFTELHAGGKFGGGDSAYKTSGGLNGVGSSVVNALSDKLVATVYKGGFEYETIFTDGGKVTTPTHKVGTTTKKGTKIQFHPSPDIFKSGKLSFERIQERLRESSFLVAGVKILVKDENTGLTEEFKSDDGLKDFIEFINEPKTKLTKAVSFTGGSNDIIVDIGFQYTDDYNETIISFVNNIKTKNGGTHETALKSAWTKVINEYARSQALLKSKDSNLEGTDIREGLTAIVSVKVPEGIFGLSNKS